MRKSYKPRSTPKPETNPAGETSTLDPPAMPNGPLVTTAPAPSGIETFSRGRKTKLTPELQRTIVLYIRAGAFDWVAAQAVGINQDTFYYWLQRGSAGEAPYSEFSEAVAQARAESRLAAEVEVRRDEPLAWLMKGPGRDRPGEPGWTDRPSADALPHITVILANDGKV